MSNDNKNEMPIKKKENLTKVSKLSQRRKHHECDICGKTFRFKKLLTEHFESDHQNYLAAQKKIQVQKDSYEVKNLSKDKKPKLELKCRKILRV